MIRPSRRLHSVFSLWMQVRQMFKFRYRFHIEIDVYKAVLYILAALKEGSHFCYIRCHFRVVKSCTYFFKIKVVLKIWIQFQRTNHMLKYIFAPKPYTFQLWNLEGYGKTNTNQHPIYWINQRKLAMLHIGGNKISYMGIALVTHKYITLVRRPMTR